MDMSDRAAAERRHRMIQEAAYFRAERRDFRGGDPLADWLEAEREIDRRLSAQQDASRLGTIEQFEKQLTAFEQALQRLMSRAREMSGEARTHLDSERDSQEPREAGAEERLDDLLRRSDEAWDQLKKGVHSARHELNQVLNSIARRWP